MAPVKPGDRVYIETESSETFEGIVSKIIPQHSVEICNVYIHSTDSEYPSTLTFYKDQVRVLRHAGATSSSDETGSLNSNCEDTSKKIKLHLDEINRLRKMTVQFTFINTFGKKFSDAIEVLSDRDSVAVAELGCSMHKDKRLSLLIMSDFQQVYIFDMLCLVELRDLRDILKSKHITKVVHGGKVLFDCLYYIYELEMVKVFDTQLLDSRMSKLENNAVVTRNLSECLNYHLNFPLDLLDGVMEEMYSKTWLQRPLPKTSKIEAAHLVAYLLTLRDHLMKKISKEYSDDTFQRYTPYKHMTDLEVLAKKMSLNGKTHN